MSSDVTSSEVSVTIVVHEDGATFSARYSDEGRKRSGLVGNVDLDTLLDWLRLRLSQKQG